MACRLEFKNDQQTFSYVLNDSFFIFQHTMRQSEVLTLMRENVAYKLHHGKAKEAVDMLEKLHK